jgi:hypothetical protein
VRCTCQCPAARNPQATLLETDARIKGTRLEAAEQALAAASARHSQEATALEEQLAAAVAARSAAQVGLGVGKGRHGPEHRALAWRGRSRDWARGFWLGGNA